jgi:hypothetical protein
MVPAKNAIDANAKDFLVNEELLLPILKAIPHCTVLYTLFEIIEVTSMCVCERERERARERESEREREEGVVSVVAELSVAPTNSAPVVPHMARSPPHGARHAHNPGGIISWSAVCTSCTVIQFIS